MDNRQTRIVEAIGREALMAGDMPLAEAAVGACLALVAAAAPGGQGAYGPAGLAAVAGSPAVVGSPLDVARGRRVGPAGPVGEDGTDWTSERGGMDVAAAIGASGRLRTVGASDRPDDVRASLSHLPESLHQLAARLTEAPAGSLELSLALAAANALLPPPETARQAKAQDVVLEYGRDRRVAVVGHFPFVARLRDHFAAFEVLELVPRPGDLPTARAPEVLGLTDLALITGSSLVNGTLGGLLDMVRPGARVLLVGPSAPFARSLFDFGVHVLAGCQVTDPAAALAGVLAGQAFRNLSGARALFWERLDAPARGEGDGALRATPGW